MRILIASSEAIPYCKTGGLADVAGSLFREINALGNDVRLVIPLYSRFIDASSFTDTGVEIPVRFAERTYTGRLYQDGNTYLIGCEEFFGREGLYGDKDGDFIDNAIRFSFFSKAVLSAFRAIGFRPDVIHLNDWQTALISLYLREDYAGDTFFSDTSTLLTIHNLGYQGLFPSQVLPYIGIKGYLFNPEGVEFYGNVNFLKAGIVYSDIINTVSMRYAGEITTSEFGSGLDGVLRRRSSDLYGILNGVDYSVWSPDGDGVIPRPYSVSDLKGKVMCRRGLLERTDLNIKGGYPLVSYIGRLTYQKGIDLIIDISKRLSGYGCGMVILGSGDRKTEQEIMDSIGRSDGRLFARTDFDEGLAHMIYAGSDMVVMPSRYEPCGIVQMIALRYGTVPIVRNTGGLSDTVDDYNGLSDTGTGFLFDDYNASSFWEAAKRAMTVYSVKRRWLSLMKRGMEKDFSWKRSALQYVKLYAKAMESKRV